MHMTAAERAKTADPTELLVWTRRVAPSKVKEYRETDGWVGLLKGTFKAHCRHNKVLDLSGRCL